MTVAHTRCMQTPKSQFIDGSWKHSSFKASILRNGANAIARPPSRCSFLGTACMPCHTHPYVAAADRHDPTSRRGHCCLLSNPVEAPRGGRGGGGGGWGPRAAEESNPTRARGHRSLRKHSMKRPRSCQVHKLRQGPGGHKGAPPRGEQLRCCCALGDVRRGRGVPERLLKGSRPQLQCGK